VLCLILAVLCQYNIALVRPFVPPLCPLTTRLFPPALTTTESIVRIQRLETPSQHIVVESNRRRVGSKIILCSSTRAVFSSQSTRSPEKCRDPLTKLMIDDIWASHRGVERNSYESVDTLESWPIMRAQAASCQPSSARTATMRFPFP
jgi:hypothetical protein